ncbi:hypothetical protein ACT453_52170, partial [Bacillus sp. D-CC]
KMIVTVLALNPVTSCNNGDKANTVTIILLVYGIAIAIGNVIGGKLSNHNPIRALFYMFFIQAIILIVINPATLNGAVNVKTNNIIA